MSQQYIKRICRCHSAYSVLCNLCSAATTIDSHVPATTTRAVVSALHIRFSPGVILAGILQVLRYSPGQRYKQHMDSNGRMCTILIYLTGLFSCPFLNSSPSCRPCKVEDNKTCCVQCCMGTSHTCVGWQSATGFCTECRIRIADKAYQPGATCAHAEAG